MNYPEKALTVIELVEWLDSDEYFEYWLKIHNLTRSRMINDDWLLFYEEYHEFTTKYAKFIQQPLELGMFVPVGENGKTMIHPDKVIWPTCMSYVSKIEKYKNRYNKAKEKVLFEGWEYVCDGEWSYIKNKKDDYFTSTIDCFTIGGFIDDGNDEITENYYKQALK